MVPVVVFTITVLPLLLKYLLNRRYRKLLQLIEAQDEADCYYQCIFINMDHFSCRPHLLERVVCGPNCSYGHEKRLLSFIVSAQKSICLCMYIMSLKQVNYELIRAHRRGVNVRLITDKGMLRTDVMQNNVRYLQQNGENFILLQFKLIMVYIFLGILYKTQSSEESYMHHKFCLIDKEDKKLAKMFFGSLNLTTQAMCKNFDAIVLTNNSGIIARFSEEFEELWTTFSDLSS